MVKRGQRSYLVKRLTAKALGKGKKAPAKAPPPASKKQASKGEGKKGKKAKE